MSQSERTVHLANVIPMEHVNSMSRVIVQTVVVNKIAVIPISSVLTMQRIRKILSVLLRLVVPVRIGVRQPRHVLLMSFHVEACARLIIH